MKKTEKGTKKFTKREKLDILSEAKKNGVKVTLERYDIYPAWAFRELQDLPCAETFNAGEDFLLETEPVTLEALDEFTVSLTFLAVPAGVRDIPVHPFTTGSTPGTL